MSDIARKWSQDSAEERLCDSTQGVPTKVRFFFQFLGYRVLNFY